MTVKRTNDPSADQYKAALDSLFAPPGSTDAKASDLDLLPGGAAKTEGKPTSFKELGQKGVSFGKTSTPGASGQIGMTEGAGVGTVAKFNDNKAALAHGGILKLQKNSGRVAWSPRLPDQQGTGRTFDRKGFAKVSSGEGSPQGPTAYKIHQPMTYGIHAFDGARTPAYQSAPLSGLLEYTRPQGRGVLFPYDPV